MIHLIPRVTQRRLTSAEVLGMGLSLHYVWDAFAFEWLGIRLTYRARGVGRQVDCY
jgi:hypothetical protein